MRILRWGDLGSGGYDGNLGPIDPTPQLFKTDGGSYTFNAEDFSYNGVAVDFSVGGNSNVIFADSAGIVGPIEIWRLVK